MTRSSRHPRESGFTTPGTFSALLVCACWICVPAVAHSQATSASSPATLASLRDGFAHPPAPARLRCYWWWLNGNTDRPTITHDLEEMKAKGFGGALLVDANGANQTGNRDVPAGPTFASPAWIALYTHALREADRLGLEITLNITSGWNLGGPDVKPEQASKLLTWTRTAVAGGAPIDVLLTAPASKNGFYRQIAVLAYPLQHGEVLAPQPDDRQGDRHTADQDAGGNRAATRSSSDSARRSALTLRFRSAAAESGFSMPDASPLLEDGLAGPHPLSEPGFADTASAAVQDVGTHVDSTGKLTWNPPPGQWEILRIGYTDSDARVSTASGAWQGLAIDYMSRSAFDGYWQRTVEPLLLAAKPFHSLKYLATDSWELGGTNWTDDFRSQFQRLRGYDPIPWLPVVAGRIVGDRARSTRFLTDLRRTVADLIVSEHYDVFAAKARAHGLGMQAESGGPHGAPIDALETFRHAAVTQTEFWSQNPHRNTDPERFFTKQAASAANIYGQRFVAAEGETSIGPQWSESLATDLKPSFDMAVTEGMNRLFWHEFTSSPANTGLPGQEYFAGTHLNPKVTWWNASGAFFTYLNRVQFLMQQGTPVNDVLYFYGDNVPNFVRLKADDPAHVLPGYDYDVTNQDALLHNLRSEAGELVGPGGARWRVLALPKTRRVSLPALQEIEHYVAGGGTVMGLPPTSATGNVTAADTARFTAQVQAIWGECAAGTSHPFGRGHVYCSADAHAVLTMMGVPEDLHYTSANGQQTTGPYASSSAGVDYIHRRVGKTDIYFLRNASPNEVDLQADFRVFTKHAELWDAVTGEASSLAVQPSRRQGLAHAALHLPAFGSTFVVFSPETSPQVRPPQPAELTARPLEPSRPWTLTFQPERGAPAGSQTISDLKSWTESPDPGIRFFSGTATYRATVQAPAASEGKAVFLQFNDVREIARVRVNGKDAGTVWAMPYRLRVDSLLRPGSNDLEIEVTNLWPNRIIGDLQDVGSTSYTHTNITAYKAGSPLLPSGLIGPMQWLVGP